MLIAEDYPSLRAKNTPNCAVKLLACRFGEGEFQQRFGDAVGVVTEDVAFVDEVAGNWFDAKGADAVQVGLDGALAFAGVLGQQRGRDGRGVDKGVVEDGGVRSEAAGARQSAVLEDLLNVLGGG